MQCVIIAVSYILQFGDIQYRYLVYYVVRRAGFFGRNVSLYFRRTSCEIYIVVGHIQVTVVLWGRQIAKENL